MAQPEPLSLLSPGFLSQFEVSELLGKGSFGHVYAAKHKSTGARVAIKVMNRQHLGSKGEESVRGEIEVMTALQNDRILRLHTAVWDQKAVTLVLDQIRGGEVFQQLVKLKHYSERTACKIMRNLMLGVKFMHDQGYVHRDLKPDNMLLVDVPSLANPDVTNIVLADFGFATKYRGVPLTQPCGTPYYIAPEILEVGLHKTRPFYGETCDVWSCGVICFLLISGYPPFNGKDKSALFKAIAKGNVDFSQAPWRDVSYEAKDFIMRLLQVNPAKRITASMALEHKWLHAVEEVRDEHLASSIQALEKFNAREKMKGAVFGVEAALRMQYLARCQLRQVKPNSVLEELLTYSTKPARVIDLTNNYLGPTGTELLVSVLVAHSEVATLVLRNCLIDDDLALQLINLLASSKTSKIRKLYLDDNPITHATGRRLLALLQRGNVVEQVTVKGTKVSEALQQKIEQQSATNARNSSVGNKTPPPQVALPEVNKPPPRTAPAASPGVTSPTTPSPSPGARPASATRKYDAVSLPPLVRRVAKTTPAPSASPPRFHPARR